MQWQPQARPRPLKERRRTLRQADQCAVCCPFGVPPVRSAVLESPARDSVCVQAAAALHKYMQSPNPLLPLSSALCAAALRAASCLLRQAVSGGAGGGPEQRAHRLQHRTAPCAAAPVRGANLRNGCRQPRKIRVASCHVIGVRQCDLLMMPRCTSEVVKTLQNICSPVHRAYAAGRSHENRKAKTIDPRKCNRCTKSVPTVHRRRARS